MPLSTEKTEHFDELFEKQPKMSTQYGENRTVFNLLVRYNYF
jgi:hypothetical protein